MIYTSCFLSAFLSVFIINRPDGLQKIPFVCVSIPEGLESFIPPQGAPAFGRQKKCP